MKIKFDENKLIPRLTLNRSGQLSDEDLDDARHIKRMLESKGWKIFMKYYAYGRESILDSGKTSIKEENSANLSALKWAVLKGWDEMVAMPDRIVKRAEEHIEAKEEEKSDDEQTYDPEF